jgi:preprotein translocase subunit SecF
MTHFFAKQCTEQPESSPLLLVSFSSTLSRKQCLNQIMKDEKKEHRLITMPEIDETSPLLPHSVEEAPVSMERSGSAEKGHDTSKLVDNLAEAHEFTRYVFEHIRVSYSLKYNAYSFQERRRRRNWKVAGSVIGFLLIVGIKVLLNSNFVIHSIGKTMSQTLQQALLLAVIAIIIYVICRECLKCINHIDECIASSWQ